MPNYLTPGIYVEEVSTGSRSIQGVGTTTAAFVGRAPLADARLHEAVAINGWPQFLKEFTRPDLPGTDLSRAVYGFFLNGGRRCFVINIGDSPRITGGTRRREGLAVLEEVSEVAMVAAPGFSDPGAHDALISHAEKMKDRIAILDSPEDVEDIAQLTRVGLLESPGKPPAAAPEGPAKGLRPRMSDNGFGAFYFPWITVEDPMTGERVNAPPSGHMAGIYARTDVTRGVHKAPANEVVFGAGNLVRHITPDEQAELNSNGVNCIRYFPNRGIRVWGARTVAGGDSEWRYVNVRRLFNFVEESIALGTGWTVFEPNAPTLWGNIHRDVYSFLLRLWRDGALLGRTPEQAFFVQCDEQTNPPEIIDAGQVVTLIGLAPVKPAEFIIFRIGQHAGGAEVEEVKNG
ncbi:phage tail sheath family protein [Hyalangium rubrum]|uniref:Phage tail sheath subtilisin-like domain-containing protein n=1 Tax=Hyalangium rubrum TaxID=3103134 RepID=A0ABU5H1U4_9BACT|nr:phage tail sheath subtilisin-like domain-containing protein [Hyalangium sp. s54d21]MDY7227266.1 phage tail sheath subtilisin-like domain-containing protein [Hyalangium sp. s54d21]